MRRRRRTGAECAPAGAGGSGSCPGPGPKLTMNAFLRAEWARTAGGTSTTAQMSPRSKKTDMARYSTTARPAASYPVVGMGARLEHYVR